MPRRPRVHLDGIPLHIVQRGRNREPCFFGEEDYSTYLHWLGEALKGTSSSLHAYALMTNHVHLLLTPKNAATVPKLVISLGRRYVQYINRQYRRTGTLWDNRYKSSLIQAETYLLTAMRYIELNPVRAAMVDDPAHYRWSSYRSNALGEGSPLLSPHPVYQSLGATDSARRAAYRRLFRSHLDPETLRDLRLALNQSQPLGNERFYAKIERLTGQRRQARPRGRPPLEGNVSRQATARQGEPAL
ncbi:MAG: transposase [Gammaproteobacteria bacterium]